MQYHRGFSERSSDGIEPLRSRRTFGDGPSRRLCELSRAGARALVQTRAMRERLWAGVAGLLDRYS